MKKSLSFFATLAFALTLLALFSIPASGQSPDMQSQDGGQPSAPQGERHSPKWGGHHGGGMLPMGAPMGAWWKNPEIVQEINLTDAQAQKIDETFQSHRLQLIDLHADLEKQEAILQPLVDADQPDEAKVMAQVDKVAQARAALERSNASMMLAIRRLLTLEQWKKLQQHTPMRKHMDGFGPGGQRPPGD